MAEDTALVEISGWMAPLDPLADEVDYFLLAANEPCCGGCVSRDPLDCIEVFVRADGDALVPVHTQRVTVRGRLQRLPDDPAGWRYRINEARIVAGHDEASDLSRGITRRAFLASGAAFGLAACAPGRFGNYTESTETSLPAWQSTPGSITLDMHSHAGRVIVSRNPSIGVDRPFLPMNAPMRAGGMNVICLAIVTDTTVTRVSADRKRFEAWRAAEPGELYALSQAEFVRLRRLVEREQLEVVTDAATLAAYGQRGPCVIVSAEGADFLEGQIDRVDEAYHAHQLRHLQLTHYRVNELGDIQTVPPVHGGLTDFGADVVRRCNTLGIVVDVAHGTYDLVKRAAATSSKPLVLSHTALALHPRPLERVRHFV
ncbi:membrane dipeptidase [Paraburkholderia sp. BCC1886]|uniref:membrane dipeptidase n=1 Tax=Paraburkholderia sp. BCC1886 TaxID=2562670 RepID=UPI0021B403AB|nr:membrane dipeptidase [Paraburkholderia sp. BCC1886]